MTSLKTLLTARVYQTPVADVCELIEDVLLCDSTSWTVDDWENDSNPINF